MAGSKEAKAITGETTIGPEDTRFSWLKRNLSMIFGLLWLAPALVILTLNFRNHIVGTSLGCHGSGCRIDPYSTNQIQQAQRLDELNHNVLNVLQLVAKALEAWFMFIATSLIYNISLLLAKHDMLPISMLTTYSEFVTLKYLGELHKKLPDIKNVKNDPITPASKHILLDNASSFSAGTQQQTAWRTHRRLYYFLALAGVLTIVANLMGPATAVLILPSLQWIDINYHDNVAFGELESSLPPSDPSFTTNCTADGLAAGNFSCTQYLYGKSLDELVASGLSSELQASYRNAMVLPPASQEEALTFSLNTSTSSRTIWVPSRQLLRDFSIDLTNYYSATTSGGLDPDYRDSYRFNQSLQAQLQRKGPTIGMVNTCILYNRYEFTVSDNKAIYCFPRINDAKCIRWGSGWNENASSETFLIQDTTTGRYQADLTVSVFATQQAAYVSNATCLKDGSCDWDTIFSSPPIPNNKNISGSQLSFEYSMPAFSNLSIICNTASYLSFANYVLNPSPVTNILNLVGLDVIDDSPSGPPDYDPSAILYVHPDWLLAAWSANRGGNVTAKRSSAINIISAMQDWLSYGDQYANKFNSIHQYSVIQALSMITYSTHNLTTPADRIAQKLLQKNKPKTSATLNYWATVQVWKYSINSHTSKLGIVTITVGCIVVLAHTAFYLETNKPITELIIAALRYNSLGDDSVPLIPPGGLED